MAPEDSIAQQVEIAIIRALRDALARGAVGINQQVVAFLRGMDVSNPADRAAANADLAQAMREATIGAYEETVEAARKVPTYDRPGRRAGYLGRVVRRPDLVRSDADGIRFLNPAAMDKEAAHWRRLNFGAGDAAGTPPGPVPLRLFGETVAHVQLPFGVSPAFSLPKGFFVKGGKASIPNANFRGVGSEGTFAPSRRSPYRPAITAGIRGRHFLEAGLDALSTQLPIRYTDLLNEWIQRGGKEARAIRAD
jgi:hypothetical protein